VPPAYRGRAIPSFNIRLRRVLARGQPGGTYNVGGNAEMSNLDVVHTLCRVLGELAPGRDYPRQQPNPQRHPALRVVVFLGESGGPSEPGRARRGAQEVSGRSVGHHGPLRRCRVTRGNEVFGNEVFGTAGNGVSGTAALRRRLGRVLGRVTASRAGVRQERLARPPWAPG